MQAKYTKHELVFKQEARTSRGSLNIHTAYYIRLQQHSRVGYGEAAPLKGLSVDDRPDFEQKIQDCCARINDGLPVDAIDFTGFPALQFAFETARLSLLHENPFTVFDSSFAKGNPIPINGLVWMNTKEKMLAEALYKAENGFTCIKFKVGALDFDEECRMLEAFRKRYTPFTIDIRLDANGAFVQSDVFEKLKDLSRFNIHSIEQPIKPKQPDLLHEVCAKSPIPVALDEELIGVDIVRDGLSLLKKITPQYIILKPTLIGGFANADVWIKHAQQLNIGWWATSALESNIGLNAIAQWCATHNINIPQGLGTGSLFTNNIQSPLLVNNGYLFCTHEKTWQPPHFDAL